MRLELDPASVNKVRVGEEAVGQRLDNYLVRHLKGVPKSRIYRMLRSGELRVNGGRRQADYRLEAGDELRIPPVRVAALPDEEHLPKIGKSLLGRVLYRDEALLVLDKPAGQAVHGGSGVSLGVIEQLRREMPEQRYMELVHRLDRETSGVLLVALKRSALLAMHRMMREGEVRKRYLALATGSWRDRLRHVRLPLRKFHTPEGERRVTVDEAGQHAHTIFRLRQPFRGFTLLEAELLTGRTHQIRVHLASQGHPIAMDDKYGEFDSNHVLRREGLKRMFLHAALLSMKHPLTSEALEFESPLPADLNDFLNTLEPIGSA